jgi:hypothetical protein
MWDPFVLRQTDAAGFQKVIVHLLTTANATTYTTGEAPKGQFCGGVPV